MPSPPLKTEPRRHMAGMAACSRVRTTAANLRTTQTRWTRFCTLKLAKSRLDCCFRVQNTTVDCVEFLNKLLQVAQTAKGGSNYQMRSPGRISYKRLGTCFRVFRPAQRGVGSFSFGTPHCVVPLCLCVRLST